ncbi:MAG: DUF4258 domain-containing protein, partial [Methanosarcinales archaeon]
VTTSYAKTKMKQRGISEKMVIETLSNPEVSQPAYKNRYGVAKFFPEFKNGKYVVVIYEIENNHIIVINAIPRDPKKVRKLEKRME